MSRDEPMSNQNQDGAQIRATAKLLRELANRAERDPAFGAQLAIAVRTSGLLDLAAPTPASRKKAPPASKRPAVSAVELLDPFQILRQHGDETLRRDLARLDIASLRRIVRAHRLDPARISARWVSTDRVISLIVEQVRARANHGRAFERV